MPRNAQRGLPASLCSEGSAQRVHRMSWPRPVTHPSQISCWSTAHPKNGWHLLSKSLWFSCQQVAAAAQNRLFRCMSPCALTLGWLILFALALDREGGW